jgi:hypothetical protein
MPYGSGRLIQTALVRAKPWQRYVLSVVMIGLGSLLVAIGHLAGVVLAAGGILLLWRMLTYRMRRLRHGGETTDDTGQT